jgi:DNA-binding NtrC family response regulator
MDDGIADSASADDIAMIDEQPRDPQRRILIVDDDLPLLDALERALRQAGQRAVVALSTFADARRILHDNRFDVLITDVRLGAFNGLQLAVLARDQYPDIQLIVFSGFDDPVLRQEAEQLGAVYLVKPVTSGYLLELMRTRS